MSAYGRAPDASVEVRMSTGNMIFAISCGFALSSRGHSDHQPCLTNAIKYYPDFLAFDLHQEGENVLRLLNKYASPGDEERRPERSRTLTFTDKVDRSYQSPQVLDSNHRTRNIQTKKHQIYRSLFYSVSTSVHDGRHSPAAPPCLAREFGNTKVIRATRRSPTGTSRMGPDPS
jgi:hypothetical protein